MSIKIAFNSVSQRKEVHQIIREAGAEISEDTELLETLFLLENGHGRQDGFGYVEKNTPNLNIVRFYMSQNEFETHLNRLKSVDVDMLELEDDKYETQLKSIVNQLYVAADTMKENLVN